MIWLAEAASSDLLNWPTAVVLLAILAFAAFGLWLAFHDRD